MSTNRFEQLIEYVINDEDAKAKELFHQIVVEKSRNIYESMMDEEIDESLEEDNDMGEEPTEIDTDMSESLGGDQADDLIGDVEAEEQGVMMDDEEEVEFSDEEVADDGFGDEGAAEEEGGLEDRVVKLEDELDNLMAEFEAMMDGGETAEIDSFDSPDMTDVEVQDDEFETEGMMEAVTLKAAPKPVTSEEGSVNKKSSVAANAGAKGPIGNTVKPVSVTGGEATGRTAPGTKDLIGKVGNTPAQGTQSPSAAKKPVTSQAGGVNTKSPLASGRG